MSEPTAGRSILVVDDEDVVHASLRRIFLREGYRTDGVLSAAEGLSRLRDNLYDLLVADLMMPEMNGIEMLRQIRIQRQLGMTGFDVPVIMITGYPAISTAVQAMRLGARDYIAKPFTRKELMAPVLRALRGTAHAPAADPADSAPTKADIEPGATLYIPHHAWARYAQDGTFEIGVEPSFLAAVAPVATVTCPSEGGMVDQGLVGVQITNEAGEMHGLAMPLSGQVLAANEAAAKTAAALSAETWLIKIMPAHVDTEVANLRLR